MTQVLYVMVFDHETGGVVPWRVTKKKFNEIFAMDQNKQHRKWACADCGTEKVMNDGPCDNCKSVRIVLVSMIEQLMGPDWREKFEPTDDPVTIDHPDYKQAVEHIEKVKWEMGFGS